MPNALLGPGRIPQPGLDPIVPVVCLMWCAVLLCLPPASPAQPHGSLVVLPARRAAAGWTGRPAPPMGGFCAWSAAVLFPPDGVSDAWFAGACMSMLHPGKNSVTFAHQAWPC